MAKILCAISGVEFSCEYLPIALHSREYAHPIFALPQKKLLGLYQKYRHAELDSTSAYLVFLAYLHSTDLIDWRVPAKRTPATESLIANHFDSLVSVIEKMNRIKNPSLQFSQIAITSDTCTLSSVEYWIAAWEETYDEFTSSASTARQRKEIAELESRLEYLCKDANRNEVHFASRLAEWADKAGCFPRFLTSYQGKQVPCNEYWKLIIRKCTNQESIFQINASDLQELIEHCEENIDAGSIYGYNLFKILREGKEKQASFLGLGDFTFSLVPQDTSVESANKLSIISNAPDSEPQRIQYPSTFQYLKAKLAWDMKQNQSEGDSK